MPLAVWFLAFLAVPSCDFGCYFDWCSCDLDAISIGGMEFCYLEFCFNSVFWSCHPVPVNLSGDCIRVCVGTSSSLELSSRSGGSLWRLHSGLCWVSSSLVPIWHVLVALC